MHASPATCPWIASCGRATRRSTSAAEITTAITMPLRMSNTSTPASVTHGEQQLAAAEPGQSAEPVHVNEAGSRVNDNRADRRDREVRQHGSQEQQHDDDAD